MRELEEKQERLVRAAKESGLDGVLLATHHNIAWLTGGRSNRIDASREIGTARLLVTADGRRFVLGNAIEMPRLLDEVLVGLDFHPIDYAWTEDQHQAFAVSAARRVAGGALGTDWPLPETVPFEAQIARARALLTEPEIDRYRALGADVGLVVGEICRTSFRDKPSARLHVRSRTRLPVCGHVPSSRSWGPTTASAGIVTLSRPTRPGVTSCWWQLERNATG